MDKNEIAGIIIEKWTEKDIKFRIEFKNPLGISTGVSLDQLKLKLRKDAYKYFRTVKGKEFSKVNAEKGMRITIKK